MKTIKYIITAFIILTANNLLAQNSSTNYVVLLDLSDRILRKHQKEYDLEIINTVFDKFEKKVRSKLFLKSEDSFSIRIIPQNGSPVDSYEYGKLLSLNMQTIKPQNKVVEFKKFKEGFYKHLGHLYDKARFSDNKSDYKGVDIWKYFNESLEYDLSSDKDNSLVVLTDGYMDFEAFPKGFKDNNKFTSTLFLNKLRVQNWKVVDEKKNYGIIPLHWLHSYRTNIVVAGIRPKEYINFLDESNLLKHFWNKWFDEMKVKKHKAVSYASSPSVYTLIARSI